MRHYLTYQHNVQKFFRDHRDKYEGVIIPLSIAASFPGGTFGFIRALCGGDSDKRYAIDPRNALFQKAWNRSNVRPPHEKMAASLGKVYVERGLIQPLQPSDLDDQSTLEEHVATAIKTQREFRIQSDDSRKLLKYRKLLGLETLGVLGDPQFLIPPYYQFSRLDDPWYSTSLRCIAASHSHSGGIPIWPVLHFESWLNQEWTATHRWLSDNGISDFWYYPNDFHEHNATLAELKRYREAVSSLSDGVLRSGALFGGYYSILMSLFGLSSFSNGIGYGEWRDSGYHRGGAPGTRVYVLKLHRYIDAPAAQHIIERDAEYFGQGSDVIDGYVSSGESLLGMTTSEALEHFMECRHQELDFVSNGTVDRAISELKETRGRLKRVGALEYEKYGKSLELWEQALA